MGFSKWPIAAALLHTSAIVLAHDDDSMSMEMAASKGLSSPAGLTEPEKIPSYAGLKEHQGSILLHIVFMVLAWFFLLPIASVFSIARSKLALPTQFLFLVLNAVGLLFGIVYNVNTPDMYVNNAHHGIGWVATWIMTAQGIASFLFTYSRRGENKTSGDEMAKFLPVSIANMAQHNSEANSDYRWSNHSRQGSSDCSTLNGRDVAPTVVGSSTLDGFDKLEPVSDSESHVDEGVPLPDRSARASVWFRISRFYVLDKYLAVIVPSLNSAKLLRVIKVAYNVVDRLVLVLGFIALLTGFVTYCGLFRANNVFTGLAHLIKGGIFFWYGLLTLGRWMGCFADLGWAWNIKLASTGVGEWKSRMPSAEFTESFVICLYGASNVFLEHLGAWGHAWSAQDFEHVSITIMFFGGGLCGMLVESSTIKKMLNTLVDDMPARTDIHPKEAQELRESPKQYTTSLNVLPALIIILLGIMMSSHHQDSVVSTQVHAQWGMLLTGFGIVRMLTYLLMYLSPPKSVYPTRPPTELVASFCLISGGIIFMASARDIVHYMENAGLMAMFVLTVTCGFTAFIMAYEIIVLSLKGWAIRRESRHAVGKMSTSRHCRQV